MTIRIKVAGSGGSGSGSSMKVADQFLPGGHPLEGVPNCLDLPAPEPLASKSRWDDGGNSEDDNRDDYDDGGDDDGS